MGINIICIQQLINEEVDVYFVCKQYNLLIRMFNIILIILGLDILNIDVKGLELYICVMMYKFRG